MRKLTHLMRGIVAASALAIAAPALAGDEERALSAISEAQGKIDAAKRINADKEMPAGVASAEASLRQAREDLKSGKEQRAIQNAIEAQRLADAMIGEADRAKADETAAANARANAAEQAAAKASVEAAAAKAAPPVVIAEPATTTVTTETTKAAPVRSTSTTTVKKRPRRTTSVRSTTAPATVEKTTTTVTTNP